MTLNEHSFLTVRRREETEHTSNTGLTPVEQFMNSVGKEHHHTVNKRVETIKNPLSLFDDVTTEPSIIVEDDNTIIEDNSAATVKKGDIISEALTFLPDKDAYPMFSLDRVHSGLGQLHITPKSSNRNTTVTVFMENDDGEQQILAANAIYNWGVYQNGSNVTLNLPQLNQWRRLLFCVKTPFSGALCVSSDVFEWRKILPVEAVEEMMIVPLMMFRDCGNITMRQSFLSFYTLRAAAESTGFTKLAWLNDATPLR